MDRRTIWIEVILGLALIVTVAFVFAQERATEEANLEASAEEEAALPPEEEETTGTESAPSAGGEEPAGESTAVEGEEKSETEEESPPEPEPPPAGSLYLTLYADGLAQVRTYQKIDLEEGENEFLLENVAETLDPASVKLRVVSAPEAIQVLEQRYTHDLADPQQLLRHYVGQTVQVRRDGETLKGTLLGVQGDQLVVQEGREIHLCPEGEVIVPELSQGLLTTPTLVWTLAAAEGGEQMVEVSYLTSGLTWQPRYDLTLSDDDRSAALTAWIALTNDSGAAFRRAQITLVAGPHPGAPPAREEAAARMESPERYALPRPVNLGRGETKEVVLLTAPRVAVEKTYVFEGAAGPQVRVSVSFQNSLENELGVPLPAGPVQIYAPDRTGSPQWVAAHELASTPPEATLTFAAGLAEDLVGERVATAQNPLGSNRWDKSYQIVLRNNRTRDVTVKVVERHEGQWRILTEPSPFTPSGDAAVALVEVPRNGKKEITYQIRQTL